MRKPKPNFMAIPPAHSNNLQLPNGEWIDTSKLTDPQYKECLRIGIATLLNLGDLKLDDLRGQPSPVGML